MAYIWIPWAVPPCGLPSRRMSLGMVILVLTIYLLASARLTRLINFDKITDPFRLAIARRAEVARQAAIEAETNMQTTTAEMYGRRQERWLTAYEFAGCAWCIGFWVSLAGAVAPVVIIGWHWWAALPVALAASHLIGLCAPLSADEDIEIVKG